MAVSHSPVVLEDRPPDVAAPLDLHWRRAAGLIAVLSVMVGGLLYPVYYLFTQPWAIDDEGYLMAILDGWRRGGALYDEVYSQYGPFYTVFLGAPLRLFDIEPTVSLVRGATLVLVLVTASLLAASVYRLTGSWVALVLTHLAISWVLLDLHLSPVHPVGPIIVMLAGMVACLVLLLPSRPVPAARLVGALAAGIALSKVNVGVFVTVTLLFVIFSGWMPARRRWPLVITELLILVMGPVLILSHHRVLADARVFPDMVNPAVLNYWTVSYLAFVIAVILVSRRLPHPGPSGRAPLPVRPLIEGAVVVALVVLLVVSATGTTPLTLIESVVIRPLGQGRTFTLLVLVRREALWSIVLAAAVVSAAWYLPRLRVDSTTRFVTGAIRLGAGAWLFFRLVARPAFILDAGFFTVTPLAALALVPLLGESAPTRPTVRRFLVMMAATHLLHAFPVAGLQLRVGLVLPAVCAILIMDDGRREVVRSGIGPRRVRHAVAVGPLVVMLVWLGFNARSLREPIDDFRDGIAVELRGTAGMRASAQSVRAAQEALADLEGCDQIVGYPGIYSWNFFTATPPPTGFNATLWDDLLTTDEQDQIRALLEAEEGRICVIDIGAVPRVDNALVEYLESLPEASTNPLFTLRIREAR